MQAVRLQVFTILIAFDGSETTRKGATLVATSPLFRGLSCHVVTAGTAALVRYQIDWWYS
jgi:hypothetical protein